MKKNNAVMYQAIVTVTVFIIAYASVIKWMESLSKATPVKSVPVVVQPEKLAEKPGLVEKVGSFTGKTSKDFVKGLWRGIWD